jgi:hypothetical protein
MASTKHDGTTANLVVLDNYKYWTTIFNFTSQIPIDSKHGTTEIIRRTTSIFKLRNLDKKLAIFCLA